MRFSEDVIGLLRRIESRGYEAWVVGGAVRDQLLGLPAHDVDLTTDAHPGQICEIFPDLRMIDVGRAYGTIRVIYHENVYEITTYRAEGDYRDGRHPDEIEFSKHIEDDLMRRDFTMNAMAWHPERGLLDLFGGQRDLSEGRLCAVGNAEERIAEDALRMMRAVRFAARFALTLDKDLFHAIQVHHKRIRLVSVERCFDEMERMMSGEHAGEAISLLENTGLLSDLIPELVLFPSYEKLLKILPPNPNLRWAGLFFQVPDAPGVSKKILKRLRASGERMHGVSTILEESKVPLPSSLADTQRTLGKWGKRAGEILAFYEGVLQWRQSEGENCENSAQMLNIFLRNMDIIKEKKLPISIRDLAVSGKDLLAAGFSPGKGIGDTLAFLLEEVVEGRIANTEAVLLEKAVQRKEQGR
ncbi:MAG: CCA tRNA nucleotidyltransferase [Peptoniphilaceae bacterium]|nr:CCA tRNA nucleotidyltransferase [Peptoniphilaceae bacterium]MDY3076187.1 CCA tRNA nucleotidyltransferase [Peptoniphilaceae bacterium]